MSSNDSQNHQEHHFLGSVSPHTPDHSSSDSLRVLALSNFSHLHGHSRKSLDTPHQHDDAASFVDSPIATIPEPRLPDLDLPQSELDLTTTFESILSDMVTVAAAKPE